MTSKAFQSWYPGKLCSLASPRVVNLNYEYTKTLENAVAENAAGLALRLRTPNDDVSQITHKLLSLNSDHIKQTVDHRMRAQKRTWEMDARYSEFLRRTFAPQLDVRKVISAFNQLPGAHSHSQLQYIQAEHLEKLISRAMPDKKLFAYVYGMLRRSGMPLTAREHAQYILNDFMLHSKSRDPLMSGHWRGELARLWGDILNANDTGAFNILLKLALIARCRDTMNLIKYHNQHPDRFTYLLRLRYEHETSPSAILKEFAQKGFIPDIVFITSYLSVLLSARQASSPGSKTRAEQIFTQIVSDSDSCKVEVSNSHALANTMKALDSVHQLCNLHENKHHVPLIADAKLFECMYIHHTVNANSSAAVSVLVQMVNHGYIPPRHAIVQHLKNPIFCRPEHRTALENLFYLCCDANINHPGFLSDSMCYKWIDIISSINQCPQDQAAAIVNSNRNKAYE